MCMLWVGNGSNGWGSGHLGGNDGGADLRASSYLSAPFRMIASHGRERNVTHIQKGLSRVGHERPLNTNSCADQPTNKRRVHESCIEKIRHR